MYTFYDVLEIVDSSRLHVLERYLLIRSIDELVSVKPDLTKVKECLHELFNKIPKKSTTLQMISIEEIKNTEIIRHLEMFAKLTSYSRNPLEPLIIMLIQDNMNKKYIGEIITEMCRGQIIKAFTLTAKLQSEQMQHTI